MWNSMVAWGNCWSGRASDRGAASILVGVVKSREASIIVVARQGSFG